MYQIGFVFFISIDNENAIELKDSILDALDEIQEVDYVDVYNDGEDWNIECIACIECDNKVINDDVLSAKLKETLKDVPFATMDYHYMKGVGNDFYWQP